MALPQLSRLSIGGCSSAARTLVTCRHKPQPKFGHSSGQRRFHEMFKVQATFSNYEYERRTFNLRVPQRFNFARDVFDLWSNAEQVC
jgi:hypothetical protein